MKDDPQLIDDVRQGNVSAFEQLVRRYQDRLLTTVAHLARSREEAEDVVQEAFVQAYVKLDSFHGNSAFYTWLYRIAFNIALGKRRRKRLEVSVEQGRERAGIEPVDPMESPTERLERNERAAHIHAALEALAEEHRAILLLREMEGCDYETISEILDLPIGTVRSRLHRARAQLRDHLKGVLQDHLI